MHRIYGWLLALTFTAFAVTANAHDTESKTEKEATKKAEMTKETKAEPAAEKKSDKTTNQKANAAKAADSIIKKMKAAPKPKKKGTPKRMFAKFTLTHGGEPFGEFKAKLFFRRAPATVENFVALAEGEKAFREPLEGQKAKVGKMTKRRFYDGVSFHRVIRGFMIQGGDPTGSGRYTPGYEFKDEFHPNLKHDKKGLLSMANPGRANSNGSQFFVTVAERLPPLDRKHSIFGEVVDGYDVVEKASLIRTGINDKPVKDLVMEKVEIIRQY